MKLLDELEDLFKLDYSSLGPANKLSTDCSDHELMLSQMEDEMINIINVLTCPNAKWPEIVSQVTILKQLIHKFWQIYQVEGNQKTSPFDPVLL